MATSKRVLVLLATGAEEMEAVIAVDVLRRGGLDVVLAGLNGRDAVSCSRGVNIVPDAALDDVAKEDFAGVVLPGGGPGAKALAESKVVGDVVNRHFAAGAIVGAICAAPTALKAHNVGKGKKATSYPAFEAQLADFFEYVSDEDVVEDANLLTSRGPGTAFAFAVKLVEKIAGASLAEPLPKQMLLK